MAADSRALRKMGGARHPAARQSHLSCSLRWWVPSRSATEAALYRSAGALACPSFMLETLSICGAHQFPGISVGFNSGIHRRMGLPEPRMEDLVAVVDSQ